MRLLNDLLSPSLNLAFARASFLDDHVLPPDGSDAFSAPARLVDIDDEGRPVLEPSTKAKSLSERFMQLVRERGDFSQLRSSDLKASEADDKKKQSKDDKDDAREDELLLPEQIYELQQTLQQRLETARTELMTGLDLLSVLMPLTDPPTVDVDSLPLPPETLKLEQVRKQQQPSSSSSTDGPNAKLVLATSLETTKQVARTLLDAANPLFDETDADSQRTTAWRNLVELKHSVHNDLVPLGALPGASFSNQPDRIARDLGVFVGCQESTEPFRRRAIVRMSDLAAPDQASKSTDDQARRSRHRDLVATVLFDGQEEHRAAWRCSRHDSSQAETPADRLKAASRSALAEELFAILAHEARTDDNAKATLTLGSRSKGDAVSVTGTGWSLSLRIVENASEGKDTTLGQALIACTRLLVIDEYKRRRTKRDGGSSGARPVLQTLSALLSHVYRCRYIHGALNRIKERHASDVCSIKTEMYGSLRKLEQEEPADALIEAVHRTLDGSADVGGRATVQVNDRAPFHLTFSQVLPFEPSPSANVFALTHQPLLLGNVVIPSLPHLESFLDEQVRHAAKLQR